MVELSIFGGEDGEAAARVMARAFADSPVYLAVFAHLSPEAQARALLRAKRGFVAAMAHHGESRVARVDGAIAGATLVTAPGHYPLSWGDEIRQSMGCATTGPTAIVRFLQLTAYMRRVHLKKPHFYLFAIGVEPALQGAASGRLCFAS